MTANSYEISKCILDSIRPLASEIIPLLDATGRILAEDVRAPSPLPPWSYSDTDGFAVRKEDCTGMTNLTLTDYLQAGDSDEGLRVTPGVAIKIMAGAPIPGGCNAVVARKDTQEHYSKVLIKCKAYHGDHIRYCGEDIQTGDLSIVVGTQLRPAEIGLLSSFGKTNVNVYRKAKVAILSIGNELAPPGKLLSPGKFFECNSIALASAAKVVGAIPTILGISKNNSESLREKIKAGLDADVMLISVGVSGGNKDLLMKTLQKIRTSPVIRKNQIKHYNPKSIYPWWHKPVFSLPGNPAFCLLAFDQFVRPALLKMMGHQESFTPCFKPNLGMSVTKNLGQTRLLEVHVVQEEGNLLAINSEAPTPRIKTSHYL